MIRKSVCIILCIVVLSCTGAWASDAPVLTITGAVEHSLHLTLKDLRKFEPAQARMNEVSRDLGYQGAFRYRGPSLATLLDVGKIKKLHSDFKKPIDLAIVVTDTKGTQVVISWGEVFYRNPSDVMVAYEATPVIPHHSRSDIPKKYWTWLDQLDREVGLPKLVVSHDFFSDRSLEAITRIEVVDLHPAVTGKKHDLLFSPSFTISGDVRTPLLVKELPESERADYSFKEVGDGHGYHGLKHVVGTPLVSLLEKAGIPHDTDIAIVASAPDGYRTLLSFGELFLSPAGKNIIIGDTYEHEKMKKRGAFFLITLDDQSADRHVKSIDKITVTKLGKKPKLYFINHDPHNAGITDVASVAHMLEADAYICSPKIARHFSSYMKGKPFLSNPCAMCGAHGAAGPMTFKSADKDPVVLNPKAEAAAKINAFLKDNKCIAFVGCDMGKNSPLRNFLQNCVDETTTVRTSNVPAQRTAAVGDVKRNVAPFVSTNGGIIVCATPSDLTPYDDAIASIAQHNDTLACVTESTDVISLVPFLQKHFPGTAPMCLVYISTYTGKEKLVHTTLAEALTRSQKENEKWWKLSLCAIGGLRNCNK